MIIELILSGLIEVLEEFERKTGAELLIPSTVYSELTQEETSAIVQASIRRCINGGIIKVVEVNEKILQKMRVANPSLGDGELGTISLALQHKGRGVLLIDEKKGRRTATSYNLEVHGTLWLLIQLKRREIISKEVALTKIRELPKHGFWISEEQLRKALRLARTDC